MPDLSHETRHGRAAGKVICGVDEVGRGPLAGPVVAAAAILPGRLPRELRREIKDSKKMSAAAREALYPQLISCCLYAVAEASVAEIDSLNILWASMLAMQRAVNALNTVIDIALIDGNRAPDLPCRAEAIIGGDDKSLSIAAASIIAKVHRDRMMAELAASFPSYGWEHNAGYGTAEHLRALVEFGVTPWHRVSFAPCREAAKKAG
ncbi:MAG: ribonuclease HII [Alphaproteobacteria bacterium]|nr:ribonuclease HII [Alphaproteobacteria bacterium]